MLAKSTVWNGSVLSCANTPVACGMVTAADEMAPSSVVVVRAVNSAPSAAPASKRWNIAKSPVATARAVSLVTALRPSGPASIAQSDHADRFVECAGVAEMALVQDELPHLPWSGAQVAERGEPIAHRAGGAVDPGQRDMRCEAPRLTAYPDSLAGALDLLPQAFEPLARRHARPQRGGLALASKVPDPFDAQVEGWPFDPAQRIGEIVGHRPLHLADEAQRQVKVVILHPARAFEPFHRVDERVAHRFGRSDRDEQPVHSAGRLAQANTQHDQRNTGYQRIEPDQPSHRQHADGWIEREQEHHRHSEQHRQHAR